MCLLLFDETLRSMYECCLGTPDFPATNVTKFQMNMLSLMTIRLEDFFTDDVYELSKEELVQVSMYEPVHRIMQWANFDTGYLISEYYRHLARHTPEETSCGLLTIGVVRGQHYTAPNPPPTPRL